VRTFRSAVLGRPEGLHCIEVESAVVFARYGFRSSAQRQRRFR
jgi:hypothetical protein